MCNIAATTLNTCSCIDPPSRPPPASRPAIPSVSIAAESTPYSSASDTPGIVVCPERASDENESGARPARWSRAFVASEAPASSW